MQGRVSAQNLPNAQNMKILGTWYVLAIGYGTFDGGSTIEVKVRKQAYRENGIHLGKFIHKSLEGARAHSANSKSGRIIDRLNTNKIVLGFGLVLQRICENQKDGVLRTANAWYIRL